MIEREEWQALEAHQKTLANKHMQDWFAEDPSRFARFSLRVGEILLDYSKNRINSETLTLLFQLARTTQLPEKIESLFAGKLLNSTEKQPALHTALRNKSNTPIYVNGNDIMPAIRATLDKMRAITDKIRKQQWLGMTGKPIRDIVNIGIGGSHLGTQMATHALSDFASTTLCCHFISNIDSAHIHDVLKKIDPETTLFIISSKSFTTLETITNARTIREWMRQKLNSQQLEQHFIAITAASQKAIEFGVSENNILPIWDWVGGRYSVWSAVGLPLAIMIGMDRFLEFLDGAHQMDVHFREADFEKNMPVIMGLLGVWYINFFDASSHAIIPYTHHLYFFQKHLQQADMESNGKRVTHQGALTHYATGPVIWGEQGCNGQHAFHQLLHQGHHLVPVDFMLVGRTHDSFSSHQDILIASGLSQAQALMCGKTYQQALDELLADGFSQNEAEALAQHKTIPGNRPSNTLFLDAITPHNLGALLALYEHKIFVQGAIWDINSFDQWGVELGKQLLPRILGDLDQTETHQLHDASTHGLIQHYKNLKESSCKMD
jgi:glucose-6-phosphate isomerase